MFLLLPSCRKGEVPSSPPVDSGQNQGDDNEETPIEVRFSSGITASVEGTMLSRAALGDDFYTNESKVGVYAMLAKSSDPDYYCFQNVFNDVTFQTNFDNALYTVYEDKSMKQDNIAQYPLASTPYDGLAIYGYYPYSELILNPYSEDFGDYASFQTLIGESFYLPMELPLNNMEDAVDYLYTGKLKQNDSGIILRPTGDTNPDVQMSFKHALGLVKFIFKTNSSTENVKVDKVEVGAACESKALMNIEDGSCVLKKRTYPTKYVYNVSDVISQSKTVEADFLMYPGIKLSGIYCYIAVNGGESVKYPINVSSITLEPGRYATITVNFSPKETNLVSNLEVWDSQGIDESVDIEENAVTQN